MVVVLGTGVLAAIFAVAAIAKLRDLPGSRRAVAEFGVPSRAAAVAGTLLPFAELAIAGGLLAPATAPVAAIAAGALLAVFCLAIVWNLARGRAPECNCFGQLHSSPASWRTVARNVAIGALAFAVAAAAGAPEVSTAIGAAALAALVPSIGLARRRIAAAPAPAPLAQEGPVIGAAAPRFPRLDPLLDRGRPVLLLFTDRGCGPCAELVPDVAGWRLELEGRLEIEVLENADDVADAYGVMGTPVAVLVGPDGRVADEQAAGRSAIEALLTRTVPGFDPAGAGPAPALGRGPSLRRRELFVRAGGAWAASSFMFAWPARAARDLRAGRRPCPRPTQLRCGDKCINVLTDERNCGTNCGNLKRCQNILPGSPGYPEGRREVCAGGRCIRDTDGTRCNTARDGSGARGTQNVPPNQCGGDLICCQGQCVDPKLTPNCGGCGRAPTGQRPACCEGAARDLQSDPRHCGRCFNRCPEDKPTCYAPPGTPMSDVCRKNCGDRMDRCGGTRCYDPETELCCGGRVYTTASLHPDAQCCGDEIVIRPPDAWFCP